LVIGAQRWKPTYKGWCLVAIDKKRLNKIRDRLKPPETNPMARPIPEEDLNFLAVLEEYGRLQAATDEEKPIREFRGGVPVPRPNVAREVLGDSYTRREFLELAITRALLGRGYPAEEIAADMPKNVAALLKMRDDYDYDLFDDDIRGGEDLVGKCAAITQSGTACKGMPIDGSGYCYAHSPEHAEDRKRYGSKGGKRGGRGRPVVEVADIKRRLLALADDVLEGRVKREVGNAVSQILNTYLKAVTVELKAKEQEELTLRLEELEAAVDQKDSRRLYG
jgi:hypothetical protein